MAASVNLLLAYVLKLHSDPEETLKFTSSISSARECMTAFGLSQSDQDILLQQHDGTNVAALQKAIGGEDHAAPSYNNVQCRITLSLPNAPTK